MGTKTPHSQLRQLSLALPEDRSRTKLPLTCPMLANEPASMTLIENVIFFTFLRLVWPGVAWPDDLDLCQPDDLPRALRKVGTAQVCPCLGSLAISGHFFVSARVGLLGLPNEDDLVVHEHTLFRVYRVSESRSRECRRLPPFVLKTDRTARLEMPIFSANCPTANVTQPTISASVTDPRPGSSWLLASRPMVFAVGS